MCRRSRRRPSYAWVRLQAAHRVHSLRGRPTFRDCGDLGIIQQSNCAFGPNVLAAAQALICILDANLGLPDTRWDTSEMI